MIRSQLNSKTCKTQYRNDKKKQKLKELQKLASVKQYNKNYACVCYVKILER